MRSERGKTALRCAAYTRVSTEYGLEQEFNSLDNQREALSFAPPSSKRRSTVDCLAALGSSA